MATPQEIHDLLLDSLKIQAEKYKSIISEELTHTERKDLDSEIKQMYELLAQMTNSSTILSFDEIQSLKLQFESKLQDFTTLLETQDLTLIQGEQGIQGEKGEQGLQGIQGEKGEQGLQGIQGEKGEQGLQGIQGEKGEQGLQGIQGEKGEQGLQGIQGEKGQDGVVSFESLTVEQLATLKGEQGEQGIQGEKGQDGLNGQDGILDFNTLTAEQKQEIASFVDVSSSASSLVLSKILHIDLVKPFVYIKTSIKLNNPLYITSVVYSSSSFNPLAYCNSIISVVNGVFNISSAASGSNFTFYVGDDGYVWIHSSVSGASLILVQCLQQPFEVLSVEYSDYSDLQGYDKTNSITSYFS